MTNSDDEQSITDETSNPKLTQVSKSSVSVVREGQYTTLHRR